MTESRGTAAPRSGTGDEPSVPLLKAIGFSKTFRETTVLRDADLTLSQGRVRGLLGQNGSGKSTLIKILAGYHSPDPGSRLEVRGAEIVLPVRPAALSDLGIGFMHQDLALEESSSVLENFLIQDGGSLAPVPWRARHREVTQTLADFGLELDASWPVSRLSPGQRAVLALARAVKHVGSEQGILILDEPTASLDRNGVHLLGRAVNRLKARGAAVLFVGHNIEEALELCDELTVLRDGRVVADLATHNLDEATVIRTIVGRDIGQVYPPAQSRPESDAALSVRGLVGDVVRDLSFTIHGGEILGLTGLAGMGHDEVPELVFGHHAPRAGEVRLDDKPLPADPHACLRAGVVLISGDRKRVGAHATASVEENVSLPVFGRYYTGGALRHRTLRRDVRAMLEAFDVRPPDPSVQIGQLSGGNQQKAIVGKWLSTFGGTTVLLLAEPVQGVDVAARQAIFRHIRAAADRGMAILYVSSENDDLAHLCDRVLVVRNGRLQTELQGAALTRHELTAACLRASA